MVASLLLKRPKLRTLGRDAGSRAGGKTRHRLFASEPLNYRVSGMQGLGFGLQFA